MRHAVPLLDATPAERRAYLLWHYRRQDAARRSEIVHNLRRKIRVAPGHHDTGPMWRELADRLEVDAQLVELEELSA